MQVPGGMAAVRERQKVLQTLYDRLAAEHALHPAMVTLNVHKATGGVVRFGVGGQPHRVVVSPHMEPDKQEDTLRHEAAHVYAHGKGVYDRTFDGFRMRRAESSHGWTWKEGCRLTGARAVARGAPTTAAVVAKQQQRRARQDARWGRARGGRQVGWALGAPAFGVNGWGTARPEYAAPHVDGLGGVHPARGN